MVAKTASVAKIKLARMENHTGVRIISTSKTSLQTAQRTELTLNLEQERNQIPIIHRRAQNYYSTKREMTTVIANSPDTSSQVVASTKSEYELLRIKNIKKNNARLRALGLISALEEKRSNALAEGIDLHDEADDEHHNSDTDEYREDDGEAGGSSKQRKRKRGTASKSEPREGSRKSKRLQGIGVDNEPIPQIPTSPESIKEERMERVKECREVRLRAAKAVAECGAEKAAKENPTATYEHCLMRVKTMTEKGLANRVKAIERAAGKHCVVKMAIFKSCLQDEGMWELAEVASDALERLKALKPIPEV